MTLQKQTDIPNAIGSGEIGGKAHGLVLLSELIRENREKLHFQNLDIYVPPFWVIRTDLFRQYIRENKLEEFIHEPLSEEQLARHFFEASLPASISGELWRLIISQKTPLAIRSSSLLEDHLNTPFAGIYSTKMIPNLHMEQSIRFHQVDLAIKWIYASTFFNDALEYRHSLEIPEQAEAMAVIIQQVEGMRFKERYYPHFSGVARSINLYPFGDSSPKDGLVSLALGLGKTIVDGSPSWTYNPRRPKSPPPFASAVDRLKNTQHRFWTVDMRGVHPYNPYVDHEYMSDCSLDMAEQDESLFMVASTYDSANDRLLPGIHQAGPRVIDFAPLLEYDLLPINEALIQLMGLGEDHYKSPVEIEFAVTLARPGSSEKSRLGVLQIRPMKQSTEMPPLEMNENRTLLVESRRCLGGGTYPPLHDIIVMNQSDLADSRQCALEIARLNQKLRADKTPYLLMGFGRWGSSDPWLGVPVNWSQICGAKGFVEISPPERGIEFSQGSHFFHNLINLGIPYLFIPSHQQDQIDWTWLKQQTIIHHDAHITHYRTQDPVHLRVDGINQHGVIYHDRNPNQP